MESTIAALAGVRLSSFEDRKELRLALRVLHDICCIGRSENKRIHSFAYISRWQREQVDERNGNLRLRAQEVQEAIGLVQKFGSATEVRTWCKRLLRNEHTYKHSCCDTRTKSWALNCGTHHINSLESFCRKITELPLVDNGYERSFELICLRVACFRVLDRLSVIRETDGLEARVRIVFSAIIFVVVTVLSLYLPTRSSS